MFPTGRLEHFLAELDERNMDNVSRTQSYLELYAQTREHGPELPWLLMAHLVSRNAGYFMTELRRVHDDRRTNEDGRAMLANLFEMLERANFLIFWDAWHHVLCHLLQRPLNPQRTTTFMREGWQRYETTHNERQLVLDLVHNEQNFIERRVAHNPRFSRGLIMVCAIELFAKDPGLHFPGVDSDIRVGRFRDLSLRIRAGRRIFDEVVADNRHDLFAWCLAHPHTGSPSIYGAKHSVTLREAWPASLVRQQFPSVHSLPEPDPLYC